MGKVTMNGEILGVIGAVIHYKRFIIVDNMVKKLENFDWYEKVMEYYKSLPLPDGMSANTNDFEAVLSYDGELLDLLWNEEEKDLGKYNWKNFWW